MYVILNLGGFGDGWPESPGDPPNYTPAPVKKSLPTVKRMSTGGNAQNLTGTQNSMKDVDNMSECHCIFCGHTTPRSDVLRKHYQRHHKSADNCLGDHPSGKYTIVKHPKNENIVILQNKQDTAKVSDAAYCFGCFHELHTEGYCPDRTAYFGLHTCKEKQKRAAKQSRAESGVMKKPAVSSGSFEDSAKKNPLVKDLLVYSENLHVDHERTVDKIALRLQATETASVTSTDICWETVFSSLKNERTTRFLDHRIADFKDDALEELQEENEDADLDDVKVDYKFILSDIIGFAAKAETALKNNTKKTVDLQLKLEQIEDAQALAIREKEQEIQRLKDTIANMAYSHGLQIQNIQEEGEAKAEKAAGLGFLEAIKKVERAYGLTVDIHDL